MQFRNLMLIASLTALAACADCAPNCKLETVLSPPASDINAFGNSYGVPAAPQPAPAQTTPTAPSQAAPAPQIRYHQ